MINPKLAERQKLKIWFEESFAYYSLVNVPETIVALYETAGNVCVRQSVAVSLIVERVHDARRVVQRLHNTSAF